MQLEIPMAATRTVHSVSEITNLLNRLIAQHQAFQNVYVRGQISNCTHHGSGRIYFTLKDETNQIKCIIWQNNATRFRSLIRDGEAVQIQGKVGIYGPQGIYQITVRAVKPLGVGALQKAFEELNGRLEAEGLFDAAHKKPLPKFPKKIGIVTSASGEAIRDIRRRLHERYRLAEIVLHPTLVQGDDAAPSIVRAIRTMNMRDDIDVLIVGRGGGSLEDLWAFNEEVVARAIFASKIPVVSAVGHEGDFPISDKVADHRSSTPSAAVEDVVPDQHELLAQLDGVDVRLRSAIGTRFERHETRLQDLETRLSPTRRKDAIYQLHQTVDAFDLACRSAIGRRLADSERDLHTLAQRLNALSPLATLQRGYSISRKTDGQVLTSAEQVSIDDRVEIQLADGHLACRVLKVTS
ncbi:exodeoxyribonuclease VII large subunit [Candidatus Poribacteria bacterium]|nr:MAG: exodeoxyribonuclease VII large subunit [Candidatus Poribacteria bacterium]